MRFPRTGAFIDSLRLASGLTLFAFALFHFLNAALGLWSLDAMAAMQGWRLAVTRSAPGSLALALALAVHLALALWRVARLKTWRLPRAMLWQLGSGVADRSAAIAAFLRGRRRPARGARDHALSRRTGAAVAARSGAASRCCSSSCGRMAASGCTNG